MIFRAILAASTICSVAGICSADGLTYTSQDRHAQVRVESQIQREDAVGFLPFNANVDMQTVVSHGTAQQDSTLAPTGVEGHFYALAESHGLLGFTLTDNRFLVDFDVVTSTPFVLAGHFQTRDNGTSLSFASFRFSGPNGDIFNLIAQPVDDFDFNGQNAYTGMLTPGHYTIDAYMHPGASAGTSSRDATLDFTLVVPAPSYTPVLIVGLALLRPRRPEHR